jgi:hypothetical protein
MHIGAADVTLTLPQRSDLLSQRLELSQDVVEPG